eukprot:CAMPEP_0198692950 /NCGR_PEP_ID=MMETSP1468-20131203/239312_1 /TAXON_ID=1461545 /ORGANISM="Mantoniella sp, Strain CCMP1436" /LENGTH=40 /DNA_ID= /DNA_START= /DNA_END= /DNA_ORIENTATION=
MEGGRHEAKTIGQGPAQALVQSAEHKRWLRMPTQAPVAHL